MEKQKPSTVAPDVKQWLTQNVKARNVNAPTSALTERLNTEMLVVREGTLLYIVDGQIPPPRLETVKDYMRGLKGNPFGMTPDGSEADAKVQQDMKRICIRALTYQGQPTQIICKEISRNAIVFIDVALAGQLIASEKDKAKQAQMRERLQSVVSLKTRKGYERH